jgi:hypothetical protein
MGSKTPQEAWILFQVGASEAGKYLLLNAEVIFIGGKVPPETLVHVKET